MENTANKQKAFAPRVKYCFVVIYENISQTKDLDCALSRVLPSRTVQLRRAVLAAAVVRDLNCNVSTPVYHLYKITESPVLPVTNLSIQNSIFR